MAEFAKAVASCIANWSKNTAECNGNADAHKELDEILAKYF